MGKASNYVPGLPAPLLPRGRGSAGGIREVDDFAGRPVVLLLAPVLCDVEPDPGALIELLAMNAALNFGKFSWHPEDRQVTIEYELLAEHVDRDELAVALRQVGAVADLYDEPLKKLLGGRRPLADDQRLIPANRSRPTRPSGH